jgi:hypothetical protein
VTLWFWRAGASAIAQSLGAGESPATMSTGEHAIGIRGLRSRAGK